MRTKLFVIAALAIATIGPPALAAPALEVKIATERTASWPLVDLIPQSNAVQTIGVHGVDGGKLDLVSPALPAATVPRSPPVAVAAAVAVLDRDPVAYHLRL